MVRGETPSLMEGTPRTVLAQTRDRQVAVESFFHSLNVLSLYAASRLASHEIGMNLQRSMFASDKFV